MQHHTLPLLICTATSLLLGACSDGSGAAACRVGAECASGVCESSGQCRPVSADTAGFETGDTVGSDSSDSSDSADGTTDGSDSTDGSTDGTADTASPDDSGPSTVDVPDSPGQVCTANKNGVVEAAEAPFPTGVTVTFRTALDAPVDLEGATVAGDLTWDLSGAVPGDADMPITTEPVQDQWFAPLFQDASYAARLTSQNALLGVFRRTDKALQLLGVVSPEPGTFRTELVYDPPVDLLRFPLAEGDEWTSEAVITGTAEGVPCVSVGGCAERYRFTVDHAGVVLTPFGAFPALRVRTELDRKVGLVGQLSRSFQWVVECFGIVATANSAVGETLIEFDTAAELRRLAPWSPTL